MLDVSGQGGARHHEGAAGLIAGSLCTGFGGLDLAVTEVMGARFVWHAEVDPAPSKILAHHWPDVPNLGDVRFIDWSSVEHVDILTAGYPCQPFSGAGKQQGEKDERHLWPYIRHAIRILRPRYAFFENVQRHKTLGFPAVLADLAQLGYAVRWVVLPASGVGAAHQRKRLFFLATLSESARQ